MSNDVLVVGGGAELHALVADDAVVRRAVSAPDAVALLDADAPPDLVVACDDAAPLEVLRAFRERAAEIPVVVVTAAASLAGAIDAIRAGAFDYVTTAAGPDPLRAAIRRALRMRRLAAENRALRRGVADKHQLSGVVGRSEAMVQVFKTAARVAASDQPVLLFGEPGTGRELVARAIHAASARAGEAFVPLDCASLPDAILAVELLGQAGTPGGRPGRRGLFETAQGGTLYLESIGRAGAQVQAALLRALEDGAVRRPGTLELVPADLRLVASTDETLSRGRVREDLLYRLGAITVAIPPLRERREDIPLLAQHFAAKHGRGGPAEVAASAMHALVSYDWPGNVRELESAIARALALGQGPVVLPEHLPSTVTRAPEPLATPRPVAFIGIQNGTRATLEEMERRYASEILRETGGNKTRAAEILGIDRKTLYRLIGDAGDATVTPYPGTPLPRRSR